MRIGISVAFDRLDELDERFEGVDFPVELYFPRKPERFELLLGHLDAVTAFIQSKGIEILSIHAPHGRISEPGALQWLLPVCRFAEEAGVKNITVRPDECGSAGERESCREAFLRNYNVAADSFGGALSVEVFYGDGCVFNPHELLESGLPVTLDSANLRSIEQARAMTGSHLPKISVVHLSSWSDEKVHLPLDETSASLGILLKGLGYEGSVILAYDPWHYYRAKGDLERFTSIVESGELESFPPPDEKYKEDKSMWHF
ncbi:MAG: hypothetical protein ACYS8W_18195 [Planctomycetota bacterium]|jgi:sugar phosphate isomerase/epimerase